MPVLQWIIGFVYDSIVQREGASQVKNIAAARRVKVSGDGRGVVSHAGMGLLRELADLTGLSEQVTAVLADTYKGPWVHAPVRCSPIWPRRWPTAAGCGLDCGNALILKARWFIAHTAINEKSSGPTMSAMTSHSIAGDTGC